MPFYFDDNYVFIYKKYIRILRDNDIITRLSQQWNSVQCYLAYYRETAIDNDLIDLIYYSFNSCIQFFYLSIYLSIYLLIVTTQKQFC